MAEKLIKSFDEFSKLICEQDSSSIKSTLKNFQYKYSDGKPFSIEELIKLVQKQDYSYKKEAILRSFAQYRRSNKIPFSYEEAEKLRETDMDLRLSIYGLFLLSDILPVEQYEKNEETDKLAKLFKMISGFDKGIEEEEKLAFKARDSKEVLKFLSYLMKKRQENCRLSYDEICKLLNFDKKNDLASNLFSIEGLKFSYGDFSDSDEIDGDSILNKEQCLDKDSVNQIFSNFNGKLSKKAFDNFIHCAKDGSISKSVIENLLNGGLEDDIHVSVYCLNFVHRIGDEERSLHYNTRINSFYKICSKCEPGAIDSKVMEKLLGLLAKSRVTKGAIQKILMLPALDDGAKKLFKERIQDQIFSFEDKKLEKQERWYDFIKLAEKDFGLSQLMFMDEESLLKLFSYAPDFGLDMFSDVSDYKGCSNFGYEDNFPFCANSWELEGLPWGTDYDGKFRIDTRYAFDFGSIYQIRFIPGLLEYAKKILENVKQKKGKITIEQLKILVLSGLLKDFFTVSKQEKQKIDEELEKISLTHGEKIARENRQKEKLLDEKARDFWASIPDKIDSEFLRWIGYAYRTPNAGERFWVNDIDRILENFDGEIDQYILVNLLHMLRVDDFANSRLDTQKAEKLLKNFKMKPGHPIRLSSSEFKSMTEKVWNGPVLLKKVIVEQAKLHPEYYSDIGCGIKLDGGDKKQLDDLNDQIKTLNNQIEVLKNENEKLKKDYGNIKKDGGELLYEKTSLEAEIKILKDDLDYQQRLLKKFNERLKKYPDSNGLLSEKQGLEKVISNSEKELATKQNDLQNLNKQLENKSNAGEQTANLKALEDLLKKKEVEIKNLEGVLASSKQDYENKIGVLKKELESEKNKVKNLINDLETKSNDDVLSSANKDLMKQNDALSEQINDLELQIKAKDVKIKDLESKKDNETNNINKIQEEKDDLIKEKKNLEDEINNLKNKNSNLEKELETKKNDLESLRNDIKTKSNDEQLKKTIDDLELQIKSKDIRIKDLEIKKNNEDNDVNKIQKEKDSLIKEKQNLEDEINNLKTRNDNLEKELETKKNDLESLRNDMKNKSNDQKLKTMNDNLSSQVSDLELKTKEKDARIHELENKIKKLEAENKKLNEERNNGQQNNDSVLNSYIGLIENNQKSYDEKESGDRLKYIEEIKNNENKQEEYKAFVYDTKARFLKFVDDIKEAYENDKSLDLKNVVNESCYFIEFLVEDKEQRAKFLAEVKEIKESGCTKTAKIKRFLLGLIKTILFVIYGKEGIRDIKNLEKSESYWSIKGKLDKLNKSNSKKPKQKKSGDKKNTKKLL